jgi:DNA-binding NarL/FixJ family response regulator
MRLVVAEDSLLVREGLSRLLGQLGHDIVGVAVRAEQVLAMVTRYRPDVALLDVRMPPTFTDEGVRLAAAIRERQPTVAVLVLSQNVEPAVAEVLLDGGGWRTGYLLKDRLFDVAILDDALRRLVSGETVIDQDLVETLLGRARTDDPLQGLTQRERDVLALMAQGLSDRGIATRLSVSLPTVGTHVRNVYQKLSISAGSTDNRRVSAVLAYLREH